MVDMSFRDSKIIRDVGSTDGRTDSEMRDFPDPCMTRCYQCIFYTLLSNNNFNNHHIFIRDVGSTDGRTDSEMRDFPDPCMTQCYQCIFYTVLSNNKNLHPPYISFGLQ
jgi:hypothetical protein